ncbi:hypothetical protein OUZ56_026448 [Daphnia magna]|uniref:Uncharacterized protein n=1 Tax=Daphnia magna TaxID=35525 RepID=A0ABQ9ZLV4_9CRUS|nr:hypothetical protein OUZ56_026448 [Daphnia magna]
MASSCADGNLSYGDLPDANPACLTQISLISLIISVQLAENYCYSCTTHKASITLSQDGFVLSDQIDQRPFDLDLSSLSIARLRSEKTIN